MVYYLNSMKAVEILTYNYNFYKMLSFISYCLYVIDAHCKYVTYFDTSMTILCKYDMLFVAVLTQLDFKQYCF